MAADVYALPPHTGRGGWTWYTGSAGWMYRLLVETLLGIRLEGEKLSFLPCLPSSWTGFRIHYRFRQTLYHITIRRIDTHLAEASPWTLDGKPLSRSAIPLVDDHQEHDVQIGLSPPSANRAAEKEAPDGGSSETPAQLENV